MPARGLRLTKQCEQPTTGPQAAQPSRLQRAGDSFLPRSSQSRGSDGQSGVRSADTLGSAWLALVAVELANSNDSPPDLASPVK